MTEPADGRAAESDDDDEPVAFTAREAFDALATVLRLVRPFLVRRRKGLAFIGIGLSVETLFNVVMPLGLMFLIDEALGQQNFRALYTILTVLAAAGIVTSCVAVWYQRWDARTAAAVLADVRGRLFGHVQQLPASFHARTRSGAVLSRFSTDLAALEETVKHVAGSALLPLLEIVAGIALMFWLSWQMAAIAILIFPITLIGPRLLAPRAVAATYRQKLSEAEVLGVVQESVGAQLVLKAFDLHRKAFGWFGRRNDRAREAMAAAAFLSAMVERTVTISVLILHLVVLALGAWLATRGSISIGTFVTFESAFWEVSYNIGHVMQFVPTAIQAAGAARHVQDLLDEPGEPEDPPGAVELAGVEREIGFEGVTFAYPNGDSPLLEEFDLRIEAGSRVALVGPSGSGKSTLLQLLLRIHAPSAGRILVDGEDVARFTRASLRRHFSVVFQDVVLFQMSIRDNIRVAREDATDAQVVEAAKRAEIHDFVAGLPGGYDTVIGERGETLSGGQRQRLAIARAIVRDPSVLLLDEATSALDQTTEAAINRTLREVGRGRTVISATHRLTSVTDMDEIVVLQDGHVVERGSHAELLDRDGAYAALWRDQSD